MTTQIVKCPVCGEPYETYMFYAGDQSACPSCREKARKNCEINKQPGKFIFGGKEY